MYLASMTTREISYLVAVNDLVVAQDIAGTITDMNPDAKVISARSLDEASEIVATRGGVTFAVTDAGPIRLNGSTAGGALSACGARILFIGAQPSASEGEGAVDAPRVYLDQPFTTAALQDALRAVADDERGHEA